MVQSVNPSMISFEVSLGRKLVELFGLDSWTFTKMLELFSDHTVDGQNPAPPRMIHDDYPIIYRVLTISGGAGFRPSTVHQLPSTTHFGMAKFLEKIAAGIP